MDIRNVQSQRKQKTKIFKKWQNESMSRETINPTTYAPRVSSATGDYQIKKWQEAPRKRTLKFIERDETRERDE